MISKSDAKRGRPKGTNNKQKVNIEKVTSKPVKKVRLSDFEPSETKEQAKPGRDKKGYFTAGNTIRSGVIQNPFKKILAEILMESDFDSFKDIAHAYIMKCKAGDVTASIGLFNMFIPKATTIEGVPGIKTGTAKDIKESMSIVVERMNDGELSHEGGQNLMRMLESIRESIRVETLESQLVEYGVLLDRAGIKK